MGRRADRLADAAKPNVASLADFNKGSQAKWWKKNNPLATGQTGYDQAAFDKYLKESAAQRTGQVKTQMATDPNDWWYGVNRKSLPKNFDPKNALTWGAIQDGKINAAHPMAAMFQGFGMDPTKWNARQTKRASNFGIKPGGKTTQPPPPAPGTGDPNTAGPDPNQVPQPDNNTNAPPPGRMGGGKGGR